MGSHMIDSKLFRNSFGTEQMRKVFAEESFLQKTLDVEVALVNSQAKLGIVPQSVADNIARKAKVENLDLERLEKDIGSSKHPLVPITKQIEELCEGESGQYIHLGATTQDIIDTVTVLQIKEAYFIILAELQLVQDQLLILAEKHKNTIMAGRTHRQQALPITFGYKVAVWLEEFNRHIDRMTQIKSDLFVGQLAGAVGTLASFENGGFKLQETFMNQLDLEMPSITWHTARDILTEFIFILGMIAGTSGKIANEIANLQRTEIQELEEPFQIGKVGSSTMPHKRNPSMSETIVALSRIVQNNTQLMLNGMIHDHERDKISWLVEWEVIPESCIMTSGTLTILNNVLKDLSVNKSKMYDNLMITNGLLLSEPVMLALGEKLGKQKSHDIVYEASMEAFEKDIPLLDVLLNNEETKNVIDREELRELLNPENYVGFSVEIVDKIIKETKELNIENK